MTSRIARLVAPALVLAIALAGCTPETLSSSPSGSPGSAAGASTGPSASAPTAAGTPRASTEADGSASPAPTVAACSPIELYEPWSPATPIVATLGSSRMRIPVDQGPVEHASGDAVLDDAGRPVAYLVAPDDVWTVVAERFCLHVDYFTALNQVRRNGAATLFAGDTLNLDPYTVTSVGSENGTVFENDPPHPMPPQA
ncbi:hypothetical protein [Rathayibacter sp. Leaf296]|uniref:hypothetical protein n=1 Tax=Rathayibacter sp. Leaf296 TaxID=1736327 RepID=UPI0007030A3E|nr:hypothetical protein [Rathayibacter sp. Leaf296]KQQ07859.1 hypothetical protein ASF46_10685 [Rathayibacter sp. Leaf296]